MKMVYAEGVVEQIQDAAHVQNPGFDSTGLARELDRCKESTRRQIVRVGGREVRGMVLNAGGPVFGCIVREWWVDSENATYVENN